MRPAALRRRIAELRDAGQALRQRPAADVLGALARVLDAWRDPESPWRHALERELPGATGFSPETVRAGLAVGLEPWSGEALHELVRQELGGPRALEPGGSRHAAGFPVTAVLLAGSIPMPTLLALLAPLALRSPVVAKCAARDRVTPRLVARSVAEADAELGRCIEVVDVRRDDAESLAGLLDADCVVATGSDAAVAAVRARLAPWQRLVARGHRLSLAAVSRAALVPDRLPDLARRLALDVALWDQLGCLSPQAVFAEGEAEAEALAAALARELERLEVSAPRGATPAQAAAEIAHERADAELRRAAHQRVVLHASDTTAWTVVREIDCEPRPAPLHRFVRVHPVAGTAELLAAITPYGRHLAAVAVEGFGAQTGELVRGLLGLGASRVCAPGRLQAPPLTWPQDGQGVLLPLALLSGVEA
jgi:acyl-CoA reductase-like NAD-dependent aldehyde dehydrogenase